MKRHAWALLLLGCWWLGAVRADIDADLKGLKSQDANLRKQAAARLTQAGKEALPKLKEVVNKDGEKQHQLTVLQVLGEIGPDPDKDLRGQLVAMVKWKPDLRIEAARVLGRMGAAEPLRNLCKDSDNEVRRASLIGLGYLGEAGKDQLKTIVTYLNFKQVPVVRAAAAEAIGRIGVAPEGGLSELNRAAKEKDVPLRVAATLALCQINPDHKFTGQAVSALIGDEEAWKKASKTVSAHGRNAMGFIRVALKSADGAVRFKALGALAAMAPPELGAAAAKAVEPFLKDEDPGMRRAAVGVLAKMGPKNLKNAAPLIAEAVKDKDQAIRNQALGIITKLGTEAKDAAPQLADLLKEKEPALRKQVLTVLTKLGADAAPAAGNLLAVVAEDRSLLPDVNKLLDKFGPKAIDAYLEALKHQDALVRQMAAEQIGRMGPAGRQGAAMLAITLKDKEKAVRVASAEALEKIGKGVMATLTDQMKDPDADNRAQAAETLGEMGPRAKPAMAALLAALSDKDEKVRLQAALAVKKIGDAEAAVVELAKLLDDPSVSLRKQVAAVLEDAGAEAKVAIPSLVRMLRARDAGARQQAAVTLKAMGPAARQAVPELSRLLMDSDPEVRNAAIQALGKIGPSAEAATPVLILLFKDKDDGVRTLAATAVGDIGPRAIPLLAEALGYEDKDIRQYATVALVNMGPNAKTALPALVGALKDKEVEVRKGAALSLKEIGPDTAPMMPALLEGLKDDAEPDVRANLILAVAPVAAKDKKVLAAICEAFKDKEASVRTVAAEAAGKVGVPAVPALVAALKDPDVNSRLAAVTALERIGKPAKIAVPALNEAVKDKDEGVRTGAEKALAKINK